MLTLINLSHADIVQGAGNGYRHVTETTAGSMSRWELNRDVLAHLFGYCQLISQPLVLGLLSLNGVLLLSNCSALSLI